MSQRMTGYPSIDKPWLKYYAGETVNAPLPQCTVFEYLWMNNKAYSKDIAIKYLMKEISYAELFRRIDQTAAAFRALGVKAGEIVTVALPSIPEAVYCVYALNKIGAVANMIHPLAGKSEIVFYLNEVESRVAVIFDGTYRLIYDMISQTKIRHAVVVSATDSLPVTVKLMYGLKNRKLSLSKNEIFLSWNNFLKQGEAYNAEKAEKDPQSMAIISHTGGTTGEPKGVMCSDQNINALIWQIGCNLPHNRQERYLVVLPPFINYSLLNAILEPLAFGFQIVLIPDYKPARFAEYIKRYRPNHISSIPSYWERILDNDKFQKLDCSCLNHIYYGGEAMNPTIEGAINKLLLSRGAKNPLCKGLGSTEMMSAATVTYESCNVPESVGIPLVKVNCKIVEPEDNSEQSYNTPGEICFSGPTVMLGYYRHPKSTEEIIKTHPDGKRWLHTGDLGYINEDGILFVTGRIKRIFMTKGNDQQVTKVFPDRIEKILYEHTAVELCCVVGVSDKQRINYPVAILVLKKGVKPSNKLTEDLFTFLKDKLPDYMIPDKIIYRDELPRTAREKIDYRALEESIVKDK